MPQNEYIEEHIRRHGRRLDHEERMRKREARGAHRASAIARKTTGLKAKMLNKKRRAEKVQMKKTLKQHEERDVKKAAPPSDPDTALPAYLLDREGQKDAKALSSAVKERRKDKAARYAVPLPQVRGIADDEAFKVVKTGKRKQKGWKRMVTKPTFVGDNFTRKPPKLERFIRPMGMRFKKAHVTHRMYRVPGRWVLTSSGPQGDVPAADHWREEEPAVADVYPARRAYQGHDHRGERVGPRHGHRRRQGRLGQVCAGDQQPRTLSVWRSGRR